MIADGVIVLDVIEEIDAGDESRCAARHGIQRAVEQDTLAPEDAPQRVLHCRDLAAAADHQHGLDAFFIVTALAGILQGAPHGAVEQRKGVVLVEQVFEVGRG